METPELNLFKVTTNTPEMRRLLCSGVFIVNFEHIFYIASVFSLWNLNK